LSYSLLIWLAKWEVILIVGGLAVTIALRFLTGGINLNHLLYGRRDGVPYFSPERVQLLLATLWIAFQYLLNAVHTVTGQMPTLPNGSLELLGLSNALYLGGKGWAAFQSVTTPKKEKT